MNQTNRTTISLPSDREILITRVFDAPRELVFRAHTDPALIPLWWGPRTTTTIVDRLEPRPGGAWRFIHRSDDGSQFVFSGEFREIVPPERIVQTSEFDGAPGAVIIETMTFEERDGRTTLTVLEACSSKEERDAILASGMEEGLNESYDRLSEILAQQGAGGPEKTVGSVVSKDGSRIVYDRVGSGPALIIVDGALGYRGLLDDNRLADLLAEQFTVYAYDRRGRGDSTDTAADSLRGNFRPDEALAREIEDLEALIDAAGGSAYLYGISSGAALAMEAAVRLGEKVKKLAMYEAPYNADPAARENFREYARELRELVAADRKGDALALFVRLTGASEEEVEGFRQTPFWPRMEPVGSSLVYDQAALGEDSDVPVETAACVTVPALVMNGSQTFPFMEGTARALAQAMPNGQHRVLEGQTHEVSDDALAPVLAEFFGSAAR